MGSACTGRSTDHDRGTILLVSASHSLLAGVLDEATLARLFERAKCVKWGLSREVFAAALARSVGSRFGESGANVAEIETYLDSLYLEDLALASACSEGQVTAWAYFVECFRPALRSAARAIAGDEGGAELADGLYAELYGVDERNGRRRSLFDYFHGRSRLGTWLRSVIAQRHVDRVRHERRFAPLDDEPEAAAAPSRRPDDEPDRVRFARLAQAALARAIALLAPQERLRLACYYGQRLTLAQIGKMFGEHEATVSRKLERCRRGLRADVERILRDEHRLGEAQVRACFEYALEDTPIDLGRALTRQESAR
jgi:RNA polymerase sigma factor (sigma-70 family)